MFSCRTKYRSLNTHDAVRFLGDRTSNKKNPTDKIAKTTILPHPIVQVRHQHQEER